MALDAVADVWELPSDTRGFGETLAAWKFVSIVFLSGGRTAVGGSAAEKGWDLAFGGGLCTRETSRL